MTQSTPQARAQAVAQALAAQQLVTPDALEDLHRIEQELDWHNGAKVVAKAWTDADYRQRLLQDGTSACAELGFKGPQGEYIVVLEDTDALKNVIVCTQCSCTAWPVLGLPPNWYKQPEYRARVVREPRTVLAEMGLVLPDAMQVRVWDTTAETRYLVLPQRPSRAAAFSEHALEQLVTREAMIGVALVA
ncbi:MAG: nitrile hydratase subunit alpha [Pseudomonadales bacterium]